MWVVVAAAAVAAIVLLSASSMAHAEVPSWVKNNAGWWADGSISESDFLSGISYLIGAGIISVPPIESSEAPPAHAEVPSWVKNNAGWWADGAISDDDFLNGIQYLISVGLITVVSVDAPGTESVPELYDPELAALEADLEACADITKAYKRIDCEKPVKHAITVYHYKLDAERFVLGPITYYWKGIGSDGNNFEITSSGQPLLYIRMLAENTSPDVTALNCTSPSLCSYDLWDGSKSYRYSSTDFTSGQIVINPGDSREFNILFGPNIGYGGTQLEYDPSKTYEFRINENFGSASIPIPLS